MSTAVLSIRSGDGNLELALCPAIIELRPSAQAAQDFRDAREAEKFGPWLPVWRQIKWGFVSAAQFMGHKVADTLRSVLLEAVTDMSFEEGRFRCTRLRTTNAGATSRGLGQRPQARRGRGHR